MLTVAHRVENGGRGEDRVLVEHFGSRTLAVVADGAGGTGGGAAAAAMACSIAAQRLRTGGTGTADDWARCLYEVDQAVVRTGGQCTAVVAEISEGRVFGASVGDSGAWLLTGKAIVDLTENQNRKPLLGSDEALPMSFGPIELSGRLLIASDGLFKYATEGDIAQRARALSANDAVDQLIAGVRMLSGALQDDVAIILLEDVA
ncbi:MAG TPA: SpoIIE family protein phosphatase [Steroidobacteraceae bacterium]|nr:SpoIIE family protein phosphatase [Steroidobacteraceae bacterium]